MFPRNRYVCKTRGELTRTWGKTTTTLTDVWCLKNLEQLDHSIPSTSMLVRHPNPRNEFVFQRPRKNNLMKRLQEVWYDNMVVGEWTLCEKIENISKQANLSRLYTNHSIWSTSVTILDKSGFEVRHIMAQLPGVKPDQVVGVKAIQTCHKKKTCRKRCRSS